MDDLDIFLPTAEEQNDNQSKTGSKTQDASISVTPSDLHSNTSKDDENYATRTAKNNEMPSLLIIGDSNVRYVCPNRLIKGKKVKRVELRNKNLSGATKYISHMKNPPPFLHIQCGGNDIDYKSIYTVEQNITSLFRRAKTTLADTHISFSVVYHQSVPTDKRTKLEEKIKLLSTEYKIEYISLFNICNDSSYFYDMNHLNSLGLAKTVQIYKHR